MYKHLVQKYIHIYLHTYVPMYVLTYVCTTHPRALHLKDSNAKLHDDLEELKNANSKLNEGVVKLTTQLSEAKRTIAAKEKEWKVCFIDACMYLHTVHIRTYVI